MSGTGKLSYEEFKNLVVELSRVTGDAMPALSIIKDIFEFIDIKKDGVIDLNEWSQTLTQFSVQCRYTCEVLMVARY